MGKYIVLTTFALALTLTFGAQQRMQVDSDTSQDQAERQETILARQIAQSAFEMAMSELKRDFQDWRVQREGVPYEEGAFDLRVTGPSNGPVSMVVVGRHGEVTYKVTGSANAEQKVSGLFNGITTGGSVDFDVSGPGCSGGPCVSGIDAAGGENRRGISIPHSDSPTDDKDEVCDAFGGKVEGRRGGCDVNSRTEAFNDWIDREMDKLKSQIEKKVEQDSDDVTVCGGGDESEGGKGKGKGKGKKGKANCILSGATGDSGILYVKGDFRINGQAQWNGPVYVAEEGSIRINGGGGTANINGGLIMEEDTELDMNGGNRVQYNSDNVKKYFGTVPSLSSTTIQIRDRSGRIVQ